MATQTLDSHQTSTTDELCFILLEETEKINSESVKVAEQIHFSSPQETVEDDREKGRADNLHVPNSTLSTSKEKAVDIQAEPPAIEIKQIDETPVDNLPVHDNVQLEKESTSVSEVEIATATNETLHEGRPSVEPVGGEAIELPVIAYLEKSIKEFDTTDNGKSPPEEQPTKEVIERETLEVPAEATTQKVEEQPSEAVNFPKVQDESSSNIVYSEEKEEPGAHVHFVTEVAEKVEMDSEEVEEKKSKISDNTILSVVEDFSKGPTDAENEPVTECISVEKEADKEPVTECVSVEKEADKEPVTECVSVEKEAEKEPVTECVSVKEAEQEPVTECVSVEKEADKKPETDIPKEPVELSKKEAQATEVVPLEELIERVAKENLERVETPTEKEQPVELQPFKALEEVIAKEISIPTEVPKEKQQGSEIEAEQESRELIETKIRESVEVSHESELLVEVHQAREQVLIEKERNESLEPPKNKEQSDEAISQRGSEEVTTNEVGLSFEPPKNDEQAYEGFSATKSEEVKEKETNDSTLDFEEVEKQEKEVIEVKDGTREIPEVTKHVQDTYVEAETVTDEKTLAPRDNTGQPSEGKLQKEEQPIEVVAEKEPIKMFAKEDIETVELPMEKKSVVVEKEINEDVETDEPEIEKKQPEVEKKQPVDVGKEISEDTEIVERPIENKQPVAVAKEINEVITKEVTQKVEPSTETQQLEVIAKEVSEVVAKEVMEMFETPTEEEQPLVTTKETNASIEPLKNMEQPNEVISQKESVEVIAQEVCAPFDPPKNKEQADEGLLVSESGKRPDEDHPTEEFVSVDKESREKPDTTHVPDLFVEPPKKEVHPLEVLTVEQQVEVTTDEIIITTEPPTEKGQSIEVHPLKGLEVEEKEISESKEFSEDKEQAVEVQSVQESKEVIAENIVKSVEIPKGSELLNEVQPVKELEVMVKDSSESIQPPKNKEQPNEVPHEKESEVIAKDIDESLVPSKDMEGPVEGFPVIGSEEMGAKEVSGSTLGSEEIEKLEPCKVTEVRDGKEELSEITNHVHNEYVEVETEQTVKGENVKDQKPLAIGNDSTPPLGVGQIHKEEEQCKGQSDKQDSVYHRGQPSVDLVAPDFPPHDVKEDEKKESSNIDVVAQLSVEEAPAMEKVGEENEEKGMKTEKADEATHENIQNITLPREEVAPRDYETDVVVAGKSIDDQKAGEVADLIAETKVEESITDEKLAPVETVNAQVNETPKEPQELELEVKDKENVREEAEVPKVNDKKEVPSKPSHKHSHNILSKVKQSLVKAKKAIIGKSPSSKTLSSEARDDIKVK
ncbi:titin isoform X1 [Cucumis melo var. makuwa]|uniref:Titin isoform X1 n=1 Tax=Cucumis melo var. makuwa TaxID=1194695 RepID=A0A5A7U6R0_CUCMM|nr:titin isoform X1 [Cucumis melo var. makuwa]TYK10314.1 titin isoform X1 [Cucumis melo var. makuwa]